MPAVCLLSNNIYIKGDENNGFKETHFIISLFIVADAILLHGV